MKFYALTLPTQKGRQIWCVEDGAAFRVGVPDPKKSTNCYLEVSSDLPIKEQFIQEFNCWPGLELHDLGIKPGQYYSRMARPIQQHPHDLGRFPTFGLYESEIAQSVGQLMSLEYQLNEISRVVEPTEQNMNVFGHSIRECLLIAAMETESHWKNVLRANGYERDRMTTSDYHKLCEVMKLGDYKVKLKRFPSVGAFSPFNGWDSLQPTKSLPFYEAYNAVKHDREKSFDRATLRHVIEAVVASLIMSVAQFGYSNVFHRSRTLIESFEILRKPNWAPSDCYTVASEEWPAEEIKFFSKALK